MIPTRKLNDSYFYINSVSIYFIGTSLYKLGILTRLKYLYGKETNFLLMLVSKMTSNFSRRFEVESEKLRWDMRGVKSPACHVLLALLYNNKYVQPSRVLAFHIAWYATLGGRILSFIVNWANICGCDDVSLVHSRSATLLSKERERERGSFILGWQKGREDATIKLWGICLGRNTPNICTGCDTQPCSRNYIPIYRSYYYWTSQQKPKLLIACF